MKKRKIVDNPLVLKRERRVLTPEEDSVRRWLLSNRGVFSRIAGSVEPSVSPQFVQQVAYGKTPIRKGHVIERELRAAGWPGIR